MKTLLKAISERFSPRTFISETIPEEDLKLIFEAARLAPSSFNFQPWEYFWMRQDSANFTKLFNSIPETNYWAKTAPIIIIASYNPLDSRSNPSKTSQYDLGLASMSLVLQAQKLGYYTHQMGGFDKEKVKVDFPELKGQLPMVLIALGKIDSLAENPKIKGTWSRKEIIASELS